MTVLFRSPTWLSKNLPEVYDGRSEKKAAFGFDTRYPRAMAAYLIVQISLIIAQTAFLLFNTHAFGTAQQLSIVGMMLVQFYLLSLVFEGHRMAPYAELLRAIVLAANVYFLLGINWPWLIGLLLICCLPFPFIQRWKVAIQFQRS